VLIVYLRIGGKGFHCVADHGIWLSRSFDSTLALSRCRWRIGWALPGVVGVCCRSPGGTCPGASAKGGAMSLQPQAVYLVPRSCLPSDPDTQPYPIAVQVSSALRFRLPSRWLVSILHSTYGSIVLPHFAT